MQLLRLAPDVILANGTPAAKTMQQATRTVPVIFIAGSDPILDSFLAVLVLATQRFVRQITVPIGSQKQDIGRF